MNQHTALLAGATGLTGRYCLEILLEDAFFDRVVVLTRRTTGTVHPKLQERRVDFDELELEDFAGVTHVFCCLGTTIKRAGGQGAFRIVDYGYPLEVARMARAAGARRMYVVSSVAANAESGNFYLRVKGEMERDVAALGFDALHVFRPSFLLGRRNESRMAEEWGIRLVRGLEWAMAGPLRKYRPIPAAQVARAMTVAAERGGAGVRIHEYDAIMKLAG